MKLLIALIIALCPMGAAAQNDMKAAFEAFRQQARKKYDDFRSKANAEYADFMRKAWKEMSTGPVVPKPKEEPVPPVVKPKKDTEPAPAPKPLPFDEVVPAPKPQPQPQPVSPIEEVVEPKPVAVPTVGFEYFGTEDKVRFDKKNAIHIGTLNENAVADAWLKLSGTAYNNLINDCLRIRKERNLCDWAYLMMLQQMSEAVCGKGTNESVLLMAYVYCLSGYKMRLGMNNDKLYMMFASKHIIYDWNYFKIDGENYYVLNNKAGNIRICAQQYPKEQSMSLLVNAEQKFDMASTAAAKHQSKTHQDMAVNMTANKNMLDFYTAYPTSMIGDNLVTRWAMYANMPMPDYVQKQMYPQLRSAIDGCSQVEAVTKLLNLVQTGFVYEYDDKVWGGDRAFFPEESLHYPYCDCEDRSILLTRLVRDLLGLKCILIYYPGHLAAAVSFTQGAPNGDYIECSGQRFFITDGTILYGAPVGCTMSGMDNKTAKVIMLD